MAFIQVFWISILLASKGTDLCLTHMYSYDKYFQVSAETTNFDNINSFSDRFLIPKLEFPE